MDNKKINSVDYEADNQFDYNQASAPSEVARQKNEEDWQMQKNNNEYYRNQARQERNASKENLAQLEMDKAREAYLSAKSQQEKNAYRENLAQQEMAKARGAYTKSEYAKNNEPKYLKRYYVVVDQYGNKHYEDENGVIVNENGDPIETFARTSTSRPKQYEEKFERTSTVTPKMGVDLEELKYNLQK